jgi:hypothetical protein
VTNPARPLSSYRSHSGRLILAITAVLVAVFFAIGAIQARQMQMIGSTVFYTEENVSWVFSQLELEYVGLRDSLRHVAAVAPYV